jgi:hypothetical protein
MAGIASGQQLLNPYNRKINNITGTKQGNKRGTDVFILGYADAEGTDGTIATHDPQFSAGLAAGASQFYLYPATPAGTKTIVTGGVFCSSVYWKVELIVNGVTRYTFMGEPSTTVTHKFNGFILAAGEQLQIKFTNRSSNAVQIGSVYSTLEFSNKVA